MAPWSVPFEVLPMRALLTLWAILSTTRLDLSLTTDTIPSLQSPHAFMCSWLCPAWLGSHHQVTAPIQPTRSPPPLTIGALRPSPRVTLR